MGQRNISTTCSLTIHEGLHASYERVLLWCLPGRVTPQRLIINKKQPMVRLCRWIDPWNIVGQQNRPLIFPFALLWEFWFPFSTTDRDSGAQCNCPFPSSSPVRPLLSFRTCQTCIYNQMTAAAHQAHTTHSTTNWSSWGEQSPHSLVPVVTRRVCEHNLTNNCPYSHIKLMSKV